MRHAVWGDCPSASLAELDDAARSPDGRQVSPAGAGWAWACTLKYRLGRIRAVSGHDLGTPDVKFNLQVATRAWRTM